MIIRVTQHAECWCRQRRVLRCASGVTIPPYPLFNGMQGSKRLAVIERCAALSWSLFMIRATRWAINFWFIIQNFEFFQNGPVGPFQFRCSSLYRTSGWPNNFFVVLKLLGQLARRPFVGKICITNKSYVQNWSFFHVELKKQGPPKRSSTRMIFGTPKW